MQVIVPEQRLDVLADADVLVCGGGVGGIASAVTAARHGAKVVLLERFPTLGGMATNALVNGWHRSDRQKMVIYGVVEEAAERMRKGGPGGPWISQDISYPRVHETHWFDPEGARIVYHRMLREAGVQVICHLSAGEPIMEGARIRGVQVDTKRGRRAVLGKIVIDATGDGDIAYKAGVKWEYGRQEDGRVQGMTLMYSLRGMNEAVVSKEDWPAATRVADLMKSMLEKGQMPAFNYGGARASLGLSCSGRHHRFFWNMCPVAGNPLDEEELTKLNEQAREAILQYIALWRKEMPGYENADLNFTAFCMGVRESRRITGNKVLTEQDVVEAKKHTDAVGHGVWMVDIHDPKGTGHTTYTDQKKNEMLRDGMSYHIPLNMALNSQVKNLAVACRAASTTHRSLASFRVQTHIMTLAQGVGTCAALALEGGSDMDQVDLKKLQATLKRDGAYIEDVPQGN